MTDIQTLLKNKFPKTEDRIEGHLVFLEQYGIHKLDKPFLHDITHLDFYKVRFFTGYRKCRVIDTVVGFSMDNRVFLLTNPIFSDRYSSLIQQFENIESTWINQSLISEIIELYRETGVKITEISNGQYQIWFGENKWRALNFEINGTLKIKTIPNRALSKTVQTWWQKLFNA